MCLCGFIVLSLFLIWAIIFNSYKICLSHSCGSALGYALRTVGKNVTYALGYALRNVQHFCQEVCARGYALTQERQPDEATGRDKLARGEPSQHHEKAN